ncbi:Os08g0533450 [Oryza sativa Japonica Group]|uniref:Os08g0533450 protein n=1 Tax=Oryza sativa subsp. japonica TaxID=39947 RepID=A0A0P0XJ64_ORYSJ|nr:hypothetical protein EE612_045572 [Oryza sativa]BAT06419.1 Os08g0533450 [Oryza sativa Japonica Group]
MITILFCLMYSPRLTKYLVRLGALGDDGAVEDDVLHVGERAHGVEQQLRAVAAPHVHEGVPALGAVDDLHDGAAAAAAVAGGGGGLGGGGGAVVVHHLVEAARGVRRRAVAARRGDGGAGGGLPVARAGAAAAEEVAEQALDRVEAVLVVDGAERVGVRDVHQRRHARVVRPHLRRHDVALEVGEHGEHLRQEPRPVLTDQLNGRLRRRRLRLHLHRPLRRRPETQRPSSQRLKKPNQN